MLSSQRIFSLVSLLLLTLSDQIPIVTACQTRADCHNHGDCLNGACQCDSYWTGNECQSTDCLFGKFNKDGQCQCDYGSSLKNGICTKDCQHGEFLNTTGKCQCQDNWGTAGITDTIDWFKGTCSQFHCQSSNQCSQLLPEIAHASCPVKGWNCYCGFGHFGHQNRLAGCLEFPYAFSVTAFLGYKYLCLEVLWKLGLCLAVISLPFGRRRPNCDHHRSWMAKIKKCFGYETSCRGECVYLKRWCLRDDLALSLYFVKSTIWWYATASSLILIIGYIWSLILWIIVGLLLLAIGCMLCCAALASGEGGSGNSNCDGDCCCCCQDNNCQGCYSYSNTTSSGNTYNTNIVYIGGPYPNTCYGCYCCEPSPYYGSYASNLSNQPTRQTISRGSGAHTRTRNQDSCSQKCCCWCLGPLKYLWHMYPVFPENLHGGFIGYLMGTHVKKNTYTGGNAFVDWLSFSQFRRTDLRYHQEWRQTVTEHLQNTDDTGPDVDRVIHLDLDNDRKNEEVNISLSTTASSLDRNILHNECYTVKKYDININNYTYGMTKTDVVINHEHVETNECWICHEPASYWHIWKSCRHAFCQTCSEKMLARKMPCPLCRNVPITIDCYPN